MPGAYNPWLLALSWGLLLLTAWGFVRLAQEIDPDGGPDGLPSLYTGALAIGTALWTAQFIGGLATPDVSFTWPELRLAGLALLPCVGAAAWALRAARDPARVGGSRLIAALALVGAALAAPLLAQLEAAAGLSQAADADSGPLAAAAAAGLPMVAAGLWLLGPHGARRRNAAAQVCIALGLVAMLQLTLPTVPAPQAAAVAVPQIIVIGIGLAVALGSALLVLATVRSRRAAQRNRQALAELRQAKQALEQRVHQVEEENARLLEGGEARYELLMRSANVGFFDWDIASGRVDHGGSWSSMLGYGPKQLEPHLDTFLRLCHPQDLEAAQRMIQEHFAGRRERVACELRMRTAAGRWLWVLMQGQVVQWSDGGEPVRMLGTHVDVDALKRAEQTLQSERRLFDAGPVILLTCSAKPPHRLHQASTSLQQVRGHPDTPAPIGQPLGELLHPEDAADLLERAAQASAQPGVQVQREVRLAHSDGSWRWFLLHLVADRPGAGTALRGYLVDIERLKQAESQAAERSRDLQEVVGKMSTTQRFLQSLQQMTELLQLCGNETEGRQVVSRAGPELFPRWDGAVTFAGGDGAMETVASWGSFPAPQRCLESDCWAVRRGRLHQMSADGSARSMSPVCGHHGGGSLLPAGLTHAVCVPLVLSNERPGALHIVAREPLAEDEVRAASWAAETLADALNLSLANLRLRISLRDQAVRDWMTGLYNRRYFDEVLPREVNRAERTGDSLTLALFDIDHFKRFNDTFGHEAGDEVLKAVANQLLGFVRSYDVACRVGGEELAVLLPRASLEETCGRLDRLREHIATLSTSHDGIALPRVTVSIGVADLSNGRGQDLLRRADVALYASKHNGRNRLTRWQPELSTASDFAPLDAGRRMRDAQEDERVTPRGP